MILFQKCFLYVTITLSLFGCSKSITLSSALQDNGGNPAFYQMIAEVLSELDERQALRLQKVEIQEIIYPFTFEVANRKNLLRVPAPSELDKSAQDDLDDYLTSLCDKDKECRQVLKVFITSYEGLHKIFHILRNDRPGGPDSSLVVEKPKGLKQQWSYQEEVNANKPLVAYLVKYHPTYHQQLVATIQTVLANHDWLSDYEVITKKYNTFELTAIDDTNLAILYAYLAAASMYSEENLGHLLFQE